MASSSRTASRPRTIVSRSEAVRSPARPSAFAHATLPVMSQGQRRRSKASEPVKRSAVGSVDCVKRPAHGFLTFLRPGRGFT